MNPRPEIIGPGRRKTPKSTRWRICGPYWVRGMQVWRLFDLYEHKQLGRDCFTVEEAKKIASEVVIGRTQFFFNGIPFRRSDGI